MSEKVTVRQKSSYETEFWAPDPLDPESDEMKPVRHIDDLTPYGMLLASLGSCTAVLLNAFAKNHELDLQEVELRLRFERNFREDCQNCDNIEKYEEHIEQEIIFTGELNSKEREKLFLVSRHCPIHKMLKDGIEVKSLML